MGHGRNGGQSQPPPWGTLSGSGRSLPALSLTVSLCLLSLILSLFLFPPLSSFSAPLFVTVSNSSRSPVSLCPSPCRRLSSSPTQCRSLDVAPLLLLAMGYNGYGWSTGFRGRLPLSQVLKPAGQVAVRKQEYSGTAGTRGTRVSEDRQGLSSLTTCKPPTLTR